ncbi:MAG: ATP-dependent DNA helicase [Acidimicrobiales bacterium]
MAGLSVTDQLARVVAKLPAGQVREGQLAMAKAVAECLDSAGGRPGEAGRTRSSPGERASGKHADHDPAGSAPNGSAGHDGGQLRHVAVSAGTGTGKSFAYLVPAVLSGRCVVVATATKALQDQLATKDLPVVAKSLKLGHPIRWAVLKGRSNYLCRQRLVEMEQTGRQASLEGLGSSTTTLRGSLGDQVARLVQWSETTMSGDRAELDFEPQPAAWSAVSVAADECPGAHRCPSGADCFTERARARAGVADVVIVNLHLLGADVRSGGAVLPEHGALVVDEAHELEDVLAACLGVDVSPGRLRGIAVGARAALEATGVGSADGSSSAARGRRRPRSAAGNDAVEGVLAAAVRYEQALATAKDRRLPVGLGDEVGSAVTLTVSRLVGLEGELRRASEPAGTDHAGSDGDAVQRALRALLGVERCRQELESCLLAGTSVATAGRPASEEVVWVTGGDRQSLRSAPLDVSTFLATQVFAARPVILTSATLPPGLAQRLGAPDANVTELDVGSPFDYAHNGLLYCAARLPDRRGPKAEAAIHDELEALVRAAGGRTLGLFTSHRAMQAAAAALRPRIPWPVHVQGDLPKPALLQAFSTEESACLLATMGFWQGVDVPGPTLSLVVIDRLPFPRPDEPLMAARREAAGAMGFRLVDLPRAATLLAQGAGRLIRTETDRGVVAVLDARLATASYSGYLVRALPPMRRTKERAEAVAFLEAMRAAPAANPAPASAGI